MAVQTKNPVEKVTSSEPVKKIEQETKPFQQFLMKFNNDGAMTFAGTLAYNLMLAMFPILIALLSILGITLGNLNPNSLADIQDRIKNAFPSAAGGQIVQGVITQLKTSAGITLILAILVAVIGGSRLFIVIEQFLDLIYHVRPRTLIRQNLVAIGMLLLFVILIPVMVLASTAPALVISLKQFIPFLNNNATVATVLSTIGGILSGIIVGFILFETIYIVMPNQKVSWRHSWLGALLAAILLEVYLFAFPFYASHFLKGYAGVIGGGIILLLFFYYFAVILLLGGEINAFFSEHVQPLPNDIITFVTTTAGRINQDRPDVESASHMDARPTDKAVDTRIGKGSKSGSQSSQRNTQNQHNGAPSQERTASQKNSQKRSANDNDKDNKVSQKVSEKQEQAAAKLRLRQQVKEQKEMTKAPSSSAPLLTIAIGTLLTVGIELLRFLRHGK